MSPTRRAPDDTVTLRCRACGATNRVPTSRALEDLTAVRCGSCHGGLLRVSGEPLPDLDNELLTHPWDRKALGALRAIPYADKLLAKAFGATLDRVVRFQLLASALRVDATQAPSLWSLYLQAAGRVDVDPPPLYIVQSPVLNAFAAGSGEPVVAVTSALLDRLDDAEIMGVLGHELTHVRLQHVLYRTLAMLLVNGGLALLERMMGLGAVLVAPIRVALLRWAQMSELSADRGELLTTASVQGFVRGHMLLAGGTDRFLEELSTEAFIAQADEAEAMRDDELFVHLVDLFQNNRRTHPLPAWRVHHGLRWARTPAFFKILAGEPIPRLETK